MIVTAAIMAAAAIAKGIGASKSAKKEAKAYKKAGEFYRQLGVEASVARKYADPFADYRQQAARRLAGLVFGTQDFTADPGYQFRLEEGQREVSRAAAARGMNLSGNVLAELQSRGQNLASQEYASIVDRFTGLAGATPQNAIAGGQIYAQMKSDSLQGQAQSAIGKGFASSRGTAASWQAGSQALSSFAGAFGGGGGIGNIASNFQGGGLMGSGGSGMFDAARGTNTGSLIG